jgi:hypothetical protein
MNIFPSFVIDVVSLAIVVRIVLQVEETLEPRFLTEINTDRGSVHYLGVILRVDDGSKDGGMGTEPGGGHGGGSEQGGEHGPPHQPASFHEATSSANCGNQIPQEHGGRSGFRGSYGSGERDYPSSSFYGLSGGFFTGGIAD